MNTILLSTAYFAPIQYYSKLISYDNIIFEIHENFQKQTYRNRCIIYGANGTLTLSVPVTKGDELKVQTKDIRIDYSTNWQKNHLKAIESAYNCSPFYEFYIDDLITFFEKKYTFLIDLNFEIQNAICNLSKFNIINSSLTTDYITVIANNCVDFRNIIHPKPQFTFDDTNFNQIKYRQVFEPKLGFIRNLSIIDMLFNTGPDCKTYLQNCISIG